MAKPHGAWNRRSRTQTSLTSSRIPPQRRPACISPTAWALLSTDTKLGLVRQLSNNKCKADYTPKAVTAFKNYFGPPLKKKPRRGRPRKKKHGGCRRSTASTSTSQTVMGAAEKIIDLIGIEASPDVDARILADQMSLRVHVGRT